MGTQETSPPAPPRRRLPWRVADLATRPPVLLLFAFLNCAAVWAPTFAYLATIGGPVSEGVVVVGDYLAFLTGARLLDLGEGGRLYDMGLQHRVQQELAGVTLADWQPYVNPPLLAVLMRPLAGLPFAEGFRAFAAVCTIAGLLGLFALARTLPALAPTRARQAALVALCAGFSVLALSMPGRQNTPLTLALLCGVLQALQSGRPALAGMLLGLLSYKPQYLVFVGALLAWRGQWRALGFATLACLGHYLLGAIEASAWWPLRYLAALGDYRLLEAADNASTHFSLPAFFGHWWGGAAGTTGTVIALAAVALAFVRCAPRTQPGDRDFPLLWAMAVVAGMLASPHLQFYDFGILVLPAAIAFDATLRRTREVPLAARVSVAAVYLGYPLIFGARHLLGFQPLTLAAVALFAWLCVLARRPAISAA